MNINTSLCKSFFKSIDMRSTSESIQKFRELLEKAGLEIANKAKEFALKRNRKTIDTQDFDETSSEDEDETDNDNNDEEEEEVEE